MPLLNIGIKIKVVKKDSNRLKGPTTGQNVGLDPGINEKTAKYRDRFQHPFRVVSRVYIFKSCVNVTKTGMSCSLAEEP